MMVYSRFFFFFSACKHHCREYSAVLEISGSGSMVPATGPAALAGYQQPSSSEWTEYTGLMVNLYHCGRENGSKEEHPPTGDLYIPSSQCSTPPTSTKPAYNLCTPHLWLRDNNQARSYNVLSNSIQLECNYEECMSVYQCLSTTIYIICIVLIQVKEPLVTTWFFQVKAKDLYC